MPDSLVVMYPDYLGMHLEPGGFAEQLRKHHDHVVAVVNGPYPKVLDPQARTDVTVLCSPIAGLAGSLLYGYHHVPPKAEVVVRIDTDDNPPELVEELADQARHYGGAVGEPDFGSGTLRRGSADEHAQLDVFPTLFREFTQGRFALGGTHGMQAWRSDVLALVLPVAEELWRRAGAGNVLPWGFDAAMILAADTLGFTPQVVTYPAVGLRDRNREHISAQLSCVLKVLLAYRSTSTPGSRASRSLAQ